MAHYNAWQKEREEEAQKFVSLEPVPLTEKDTMAVVTQQQQQQPRMPPRFISQDSFQAAPSRAAFQPQQNDFFQASSFNTPPSSSFSTLLPVQMVPLGPSSSGRAGGWPGPCTSSLGGGWPGPCTTKTTSSSITSPCSLKGVAMTTQQVTQQQQASLHLPALATHYTQQQQQQQHHRSSSMADLAAHFDDTSMNILVRAFLSDHS